MLDLLLLERRFLFRRGQNQAVRAVQGGPQPLGDLGEERLDQVGHDECHDVGASRDECLRGRVGREVELADALEDAHARVFADVRVI
ncbi:MAG TPA: hypothetical protein VHJ58_11920, partial [Vicinamibacterales bacterium]|nr:hypothetical protein [Vicinamibacterales bacterium]